MSVLRRQKDYVDFKHFCVFWPHVCVLDTYPATSSGMWVCSACRVLYRVCVCVCVDENAPLFYPCIINGHTQWKAHVVWKECSSISVQSFVYKEESFREKKNTTGHFFFSVVRFVFKNTLSAIEILSVALEEAVDKASPVTYIFTQRTSKIATWSMLGEHCPNQTNVRGRSVGSSRMSRTCGLSTVY